MHSPLAMTAHNGDGLSDPGSLAASYKLSSLPQPFLHDESHSPSTSLKDLSGMHAIPKPQPEIPGVIHGML